MQAKFWTVNALAIELERDRRTLAKLLEGLTPDIQDDSGSRVTRKWRMSRVFAHLSGGDAELDGNAERARKDKEAADKLALENAQTRNELGRIDEMATVFGGHIERARARLIQVPDVLGQFCDPKSGPKLIGEARRLIHEALTELAADAASGAGIDLAQVAAATDPEGERVVGPISKAVERKQRGARAVAN
jgi:hypothetical protein